MAHFSRQTFSRTFAAKLVLGKFRQLLTIALTLTSSFNGPDLYRSRVAPYMKMVTEGHELLSDLFSKLANCSLAGSYHQHIAS